jgi:hypothetical protein
MKRLNLGPSIAACVAGALLTSGSALAGERFHFPVIVDITGAHAVGSIGSARNSADPLQMLGCRVLVEEGFALGVCFARDSAGVSVQCVTVNSDMVAAIRAVAGGGDSIVSFHWDKSGLCTLVNVSNDSGAEPKLP